MPDTTNFITIVLSALLSFFASVFAGVNGIEASCAFGGAVVFVVISKEFKWTEKIIFFVVSFLIGIHSAEFTASMINGFTPEFIRPTRAIGAFFSSALSVNLVIFLIAAMKNPLEMANKIINLMNKFKGKNTNEPE